MRVNVVVDASSTSLAMVQLLIRRAAAIAVRASNRARRLSMVAADTLVVRAGRLRVLSGTSRQESATISKLMLITDLDRHRHLGVVRVAARRASVVLRCTSRRLVLRGATAGTGAIMLVVERGQILAVLQHKWALHVLLRVHPVIVVVLLMIVACLHLVVAVRMVMLLSLAVRSTGVASGLLPSTRVVHVHLLLNVHVVLRRRPLLLARDEQLRGRLHARVHQVRIVLLVVLVMRDRAVRRADHATALAATRLRRTRLASLVLARIRAHRCHDHILHVVVDGEVDSWLGHLGFLALRHILSTQSGLVRHAFTLAHGAARSRVRVVHGVARVGLTVLVVTSVRAALVTVMLVVVGTADETLAAVALD